MASTVRKILVWLLSLLTVISVYLVYLRFTHRPQIETTTPTQPATDSADFKREIGTIGDVGVANVEIARYMNFNTDGTVNNEFGFAKLLHDTGSSWEIEKPFMNIFRKGFTCNITAQTGHVLLEPGLKKPSPKDAALTGNVIIKIIPEKDSSMKPGTFYLDDIIFVSEKSLLSSDGPVRFVSEDAVFSGTGFELIYNQQFDRLEFLRIVDLKSLKIKTKPAASPITPAKAPSAQDNSTSPPTSASTNPTRSAVSPSPPAAETADYKYRCLLQGNVLIDSPEQLILAETVFINNIIANNDNDTPPETDTPENADKNNIPSEPSTPAAPQEPPTETLTEITITCEKGILVKPMDSTFELDQSPSNPPQHTPTLTLPADAAHRTTCITERIDYDFSSDNIYANGATNITFYPSHTADQNEPPKDLPIKITTHKQTTFLSAAGKVIFEGDSLCSIPRKTADSNSLYTLAAPIITADLTSDKNTPSASLTGIRQLTTTGPTTLTFYKDTAKTDEKSQPLEQLRITAQEKTEFLPALNNQVTFQGNCVCTMTRTDPNTQLKRILSAPLLVVNLFDSNDSSTPDSVSGVKHVTASGGGVRLSTTKTATATNKTITSSELKCSRFEYDALKQFFIAIGPGIIKVDNSNITEPQPPPTGFSLKRKCYAIVQDFDSLQYFFGLGKFIADAETQSMLVNYVPIDQGQTVTVTTSRVEALFAEPSSDQPEISSLTATGGIHYIDNDKEFIGSKLFYDAPASIVTVNGNNYQPCRLNGVAVDQIKFNLETNKIKAKVVGPGSLQMK